MAWEGHGMAWKGTGVGVVQASGDFLFGDELLEEGPLHAQRIQGPLLPHHGTVYK